MNNIIDIPPKIKITGNYKLIPFQPSINFDHNIYKIPYNE